MDKSITAIKPEDLAKIQADLKAEAQAAPNNPIEQALESADAIRDSLLAVKGEKYARLVEIGVLIHKQNKLMAFVTDVLSEAFEDFSDDQRNAMAHISASLGAKTLSHASLICHDNKDLSKEQAKELTEWMDRIVDAEEQGVNSIASQLFGKEDQ